MNIIDSGKDWGNRGDKGEKKKLISLGYKDNFDEKMFLKIDV